MSPLDPLLDQLLAETLDALERDGSAALERACERAPELAAGLRRRVGLLAAANLLELGPDLAELPERLGDFEVLERLGEGAMGLVLRARQVSTGREVALKLVRPQLLLFPEARERFRREVELSARLHHPGILPVLGVGETDGLPWFALELVRGTSASALLAGVRASFDSAGRVDPARLPELLELATPASLRTGARLAAPRSWKAWALTTTLAVARAVAHAHEKGVLHRDLKPSNVLVASDGRVHLTDFGLALAPGEASLTRSHAAVGSLPYMAPEVLEGAGADARSDVYGLGALGYELLTLHRPFEDESSAALVRAVLAGDPTPPRRHAPELGADEEAVLLHALERDPRRRYATAAELVQDLEALIERRPTRARPSGPWRRFARLVQRRPAASAAVALGLLLLFGTPTAVALTEARARRGLQAVNAELDLALSGERAERERADRNLERATEAVHALLSETGVVLLDEVPFMQSLKRDLLERALVLLEPLVPQSLDEPRRMLQAASVELAAGLARLQLGELESARAHFTNGLARLDACAECEHLDPERALALRVRLLRNFARAETDRAPAEAERMTRAAVDLAARSTSAALRTEGAMARNQLGSLLSDAGREREAREVLDEAEARLADESSDFPPLELARLRAMLLGQRGLQAYLENDDERAEQDLRAGLAALERVRELDPEAVRPRTDAVSLAINLGASLVRSGELESAEATLTTARADAEELVRLFPRAVEFRIQLAGILVNLGLLREARGDSAGCREAWEAAAEAGRRLAATPDVGVQGLFQAGLALSNLASHERDEGRFEQAIALSLEAEGVLRRGLALQPQHLVLGRALEFARLTRCRAALSLQRFDEAEAALQLAEDVAPPERLAQRALVDAWIHFANAGDESLRDELLERALAALNRAVELGWDDRDDLERNDFLDPLRELPGFPAAP